MSLLDGVTEAAESVADAVKEAGQKTYGPGFWGRVANTAGGIRLEYTPELLNEVITDLKDLVADLRDDIRAVEAMREHAVAPSEDYASEAYVQTHEEGLRDLHAKHEQMRSVAEALLERHLAAKQNLDQSEDDNVEGIGKQIRGIADS